MSSTGVGLDIPPPPGTPPPRGIGEVARLIRNRHGIPPSRPQTPQTKRDGTSPLRTGRLRRGSPPSTSQRIRQPVTQAETQAERRRVFYERIFGYIEQENSQFYDKLVQIKKDL